METFHTMRYFREATRGKKRGQIIFKLLENIHLTELRSVVKIFLSDSNIVESLCVEILYII